MLHDDDGEVVTAAIQTYGDTIHSLVERRNYRGRIHAGVSPGGVAIQPRRPSASSTSTTAWATSSSGAMNRWVEFYERVLGFYNLISFDDKAISTEYSALMSKVVSNGNGRIKFPLNEPAKGKTEVADRRVPGVLRRAGRPAHRDRDRRHRRDRHARCVTAASSSSACPVRTTTRCSIASVTSTKTSRRCVTSAFWWIGTMKDICSRSSRSRCRTVRRCSTRSSSARAPRASAPAISRRCSKRSSASRRSEGNL